MQLAEKYKRKAENLVCRGSADLMDLEDGDERSVQIIRLRLLGVVDLNGMLPALQVEHR